VKNILLFLLIFLTPIGVYAARCNVNGKWYPYSDPICSNGDQETSPSSYDARKKATVPSSPIKEVTAKALYEAFENNEIAAEAQYKDKPIVITGTVTNVKKNIAGQPIVYLEAGTLQYVSCRFPKTSISQLVDIQKGEKARLSCRVDHKIITTIHLSNCSIQ
jgi:hypothetical protein